MTAPDRQAEREMARLFERLTEGEQADIECRSDSAYAAYQEVARAALDLAEQLLKECGESSPGRTAKVSGPGLEPAAQGGGTADLEGRPASPANDDEIDYYALEDGTP